MSSILGTKKKPVSSTGWGDHGSHREPTINAGQHPSDDTHSQSMRKPPLPAPAPDQQRRDEGYTTNAGQHPSDDTDSHSMRKPPLAPPAPDQQRRDEGYNQTYDTKTQGQRQPSVTSREDGTNRLPPADHARNDDHGQRGANMGYGGSSKHSKDGYNGRSRPKEEAYPPRGEDNGQKPVSSRSAARHLVQATIKKFSAGVAENYDDEIMQSEEHEMRPEARIRTLQQQLHRLKAENDAHARTIENLRGDLQIEAENSKKIKESANKMAYAMESKDLYVGRQDSDDAVYSRFQVLIGHIKTWSVPFAQDCPPSHLEFRPEVIEEFRKVAPTVTDFTGFLQIPKNMRLFVRGYVSLVIAETLFRTLPTATHSGSGAEDIWMHRKLAHGVFAIENRLFYADRKSISARELHDWRALTTTLVSKLDDGTSKTGEGMEKYVTQCIKRIMGVVGNWVATENRKALEEALLTALLQAVKLSQTLRCQRAHWSVRHLGDTIHPGSQSGPPNGLVFFNEASMDDKYGEGDSDEEGANAPYGKIVEVFVTPGLFKSGNSDGERFDIETCVERSEVKCRAL